MQLATPAPLLHATDFGGPPSLDRLHTFQIAPRIFQRHPEKKEVLRNTPAETLTDPGLGQDGEKGMQSNERGDYATALRRGRPFAEQGAVSAPPTFSGFA